MADFSGVDDTFLSDGAYSAEVTRLLAMIRAAESPARAQVIAEQRLALLHDRRFLLELVRSTIEKPAAAWRAEGLAVAATLARQPSNQIDQAALALLWFLWQGADDAFRQSYGPLLDPLFYRAVALIAESLRPIAPKNSWLAALSADRCNQAISWSRGWVAALLDEVGDNVAALQGAAAMLALVRRARQRLTLSFFRLEAAAELRENGGFDLILAFWAWVQREAIGLVLEIQQAPDPILADILLRRAVTRIHQWRAEAEAAGRTVLSEVGTLHKQLVSLPQTSNLPRPLTALRQVGRVTTPEELYNLVCQEPWLLADSGLIVGGLSGDAYFMLDTDAQPRQVGLNLTLLGQLRAAGATVAGNPIAAAAQRVYSRELTMQAVLANWQRGPAPDLLQLIAAAVVTTDLCDRNNKLGICQANLCYQLAEALPDQPILKIIAATNYAYAHFGEGETTTLVAIMERACESARQANHAAALVNASDLLAQIYAAMGDFERASEAYSEETRAVLALPYRPARAGAVLGMADLCFELGEIDQLEVYLNLLTHYGVPDDVTVSAGRYWALKSYTERMRDSHEQALDSWARSGDLAVSLLNVSLAKMLIAQATAAGYSDELLWLIAAMREAADKAGDATMASQFAAEYIRQVTAIGRMSELPAAYQRLAELTQLANLPNGDREKLVVLFAQIEALIGQQQSRAALPLLEEAEALAEQLGEYNWMLDVDFTRARAGLELGAAALVRTALDHIDALRAQMPASLWTAKLAGELARIQAMFGEELQQQGRVEAAERLFLAAEKAWKEIMLDENVPLDLRRRTMGNLRIFYRRRGKHSSLYMLAVVWAELENSA